MDFIWNKGDEVQHAVYDYSGVRGSSLWQKPRIAIIGIRELLGDYVNRLELLPALSQNNPNW